MDEIAGWSLTVEQQTELVLKVERRQNSVVVNMLSTGRKIKNLEKTYWAQQIWRWKVPS